MLTLKHVRLLWFALPLVATLIIVLQASPHYNNYLIFKQVFWHTIEGKNLYTSYPLEYFDTNHYGPLFAVIIAPFALLPTGLGVFCWCMANVALLYYAVTQLPLSDKSKRVVLLITLIETLTAIQNQQVNPIITASIILAFVFTNQNRPLLATGLIIAGTMIKLYSVVGLAFIFLSKDRVRFFAYCILWSLFLFVLPMLLSRPGFILQSYCDWYHAIIDKHTINMQSYQSDRMQDISITGFVRRITGYYGFSSLYFLVPAALCSLFPLTRYQQLGNSSFQLTYLAQLLIGVVIFSSSAESSTYVIAVTGFAIWYVNEDVYSSTVLSFLLLSVLVLTVFSPTDLFPRMWREKYVIQYSLKSLPCAAAWFFITHKLIRFEFSKPALNK